MVATFAGASGYYYYRDSSAGSTDNAVSPRKTPSIIIETSKTKSSLSKEENRELLSSQHIQVKKGLEDPGVYAWGSNSGRVVDPDSTVTIVKAPRRIKYFNGKLLRDLKLDEKSGAAIAENGDLIQWGKGFSDTDFQPTTTLTGRNLISLTMSRDRIIALSSSGDVYSVPISKADQETGIKPRESSWIPFYTSQSHISYRPLIPKLGLGEKVTALSGGLEHVVLLTNAGRVFTAVATASAFPARGQLGVPGLTWFTRPEGPADQCHELLTLRGFKINQAASGDLHTLLLDKDGRVFAFGDNSFGQLGRAVDSAKPFIDQPTFLPMQGLYQGKGWITTVTGIAAGGYNSFMTVDAQRVVEPGADSLSDTLTSPVIADTWAFGKGIYGTLGNGRWTHLQDVPTKVKALSGLFEYNERDKKVEPIRLDHISVGSSHAAAVLKNQAYLGAAEKSSVADTNWGLDALWWGGNETFQLGTGKRSNLPTPTYISAPADATTPGGNQEARIQILPRHKARIGNRTVMMGQRVECGRFVSAVYSAV
jgi:alpha-tubulin suppressor-like RCC1 family protein